jgi:hypothetical protein
MPTPPYQFIAIARTIARGFTEQAIGRPDGEALTEAARAIWRGIEVLEGMDRHERPGATRSMRSVRRALSAAPVLPRSLIDPTRPRVERLVGIASARPSPDATGGGGDAP